MCLLSGVGSITIIVTVVAVDPCEIHGGARRLCLRGVNVASMLVRYE